MERTGMQMLKCKRTRFVYEDGRIFRPIGFGLGGALYPEGYMWQVFGGSHNLQKFCESPTYIYNALAGLVGKEDADAFWRAYLHNWLSREDIQSMAKWGVNHVRLPLTYKTLTDRPGHYLEEGFSDLKRIVDWCREAGIYVVLDLHAAPGGQNAWHFCDSDGTARLWTEPETYWPWTIDLWQEITRRYKDDPCIMGYDLLNETHLPQGHTNAELRDLSVAITRAIREIDPLHIVFIEGSVYATNFDLLEPFDDNMTYSFHLYKYGGPPPEKQDMQKYLDLRYRTGVPLWNGETGDNNAAWWTADIALHKRHEIGVCMWTHKKIINSNQPYVVKMAEGFYEICQYISERGPKPDAEKSRAALREQAELMKSRNCVFQPEFLEGFGWYESDFDGPLYLDPKAPIDRRVEDLLSRMTLDEKQSQLGNSCAGIERLRLPAFRDGEVEHGVSVIGVKDPAVGTATVFPQASAMAATFDKRLIERMALAISDEVRAKYNQGLMGLAFCSPVIDLARDPRWGRCQECFGEDPTLAAVLGMAFISGLVGGADAKQLKTLAGPKHFTANSCEATRRDGGVEITERMMWEYYLRPFERCLELIDYHTIMPSYNGVNGMPGAANYWLLTSVLREMMGFEGYVLSDGQAVYDLYRAHHAVTNMAEASAISLAAGCDVSNGRGLKEYAAEAVTSGLIKECDMDEGVRRALKARFRLGLLDSPDQDMYRNIGPDIIDCPEHRQIARKVSEESIVLLQNDGILPLRNIMRVALIGPYARNTFMGTYSGIASHIVTPEDGLRSALGKDAELSVWPLYDGGVCKALLPEACLKTPDGRPGLLAEYFVNRYLMGHPAEVRVETNLAFDWRFRSPFKSVEAESAWSVRMTGFVHAPKAREYTFSIHADNGIRLVVDGRTLIDSWGLFQPRTLEGTMFLSEGDHTVVFEHYGQGEGTNVSVGWDFIDEDEYAAAMRAAKEADAVIVCVGTNRYVEDESSDRESIRLQSYQEALVQSVHAQNPNTIAVIFSGGPVSSPWMAENLPAVLQAWYPGQEGGDALADILLGNASPSGRMPFTVYRDDSDLPLITQYELDQTGTTYLYYGGKPLYAFGHGLGYTTFGYGSLRTDKVCYVQRDVIHVAFDVENTGAMTGAEVAQLYVTAPKGEAKRPIRQLMAFDRVELMPGERKTISANIPVSMLYRFDEKLRRKVVDTGEYVFAAGAASDDIRLTAAVWVDGQRARAVHGLNLHNG